MNVSNFFPRTSERMATNDLPLNELFGIPEGPIPPVDPADLRRVWKRSANFKRVRPPNRSGNPPP